jgi:hypothetical protein
MMPPHLKHLPLIAILALGISCAPAVTPHPQSTLATFAIQSSTPTELPTSTPARVNTPTLIPTPSPTIPLAANTPTFRSIAQRIDGRTFPSVFQAWNKADNLGGENPDKTEARHDLGWFSLGQFGLRWDNSFPGLGTAFNASSLANALAKRTRLLEYNPNMLMLTEMRYRDAPASWLPEDHPAWQRDAAGKRMPATGKSIDGYLFLDWRKPAFRTLLATQAKAIVESGVFDGIMLDWWDDNDADRINLVKEIRSAIGEDKLIIVNSNARTAPQAAPYVNGLFMESCFSPGSGQACAAPNSPQDWQRISDTLRWAESTLRSPHINAVETWFENSRGDLNRMRATTTLALTHSNGYALFGDPNTLPAPDHLHDWYPFWDHKELGKPTAAMIKRSDGAFQREFEGGTVIYNPMGNPSITVTFPQPRISAATGQTSTAFSLQGMDGDLYLIPK